MSSSQPAPGGLQVERVLDDLIHRLVNAENGPEVKAALIEARRMKNVAARWGAIPPPPDARREMLARVMELSESVSASAKKAPVTGPHKPFVAPPDSTKPFPNRPSKEAAAAETLSPPPTSPMSASPSRAPPRMPELKSSSPSIRPREETVDDIRVPKPAPMPNIEPRGRPLTLRPPTSVEIDRSDQPFAKAASSSPSTGEKAPPIQAVAVRGDALEGLSSSISSSKIRAEAQTSSRPSVPPSMPPLPPRPSSAKPLPASPSAPPPPLPQKPILQRKAPPMPRRASSAANQVPSSKPPVLSAGPTPLPPAPGDVSVTLAEGVTLVRPTAAEWQPHPLWRGTSVKLLAHDPEKGEYTALVHLSRGSSLPARRHVSVEEMWMIEGVAFVGDIEMKASEYSRSDVGAVHPKIVSTGGCTFLLRGNENDEILSDSNR